MSIKKIHLIHNSHTDIGYTQTQEKIKQYHNDFIEKVIEILDEDFFNHNESKFRWTLENYWQVENFLKLSDEVNINKFFKYIETKNIEVTLNYLNMTELIDNKLYTNLIKRATSFCSQNNIDSHTALSSDINGYSWGFCDVLSENKVENLVSCIHTHHGYAPFSHVPKIFNWESQKNNIVRVYKADHYHLGNELGLVPFAGNTYMIEDENNYGPKSTKYNDYNFMQQRVTDYISYVEENGYEFENILIFCSGMTTDNGGPNPLIIDRINQFNLNNEIEIELSTLDRFFKSIDKEDKKIQCYRGDFNDWWADDVGSTPAATKVCKEAQRKYEKIISTDFSFDPALISELENNIALYCEHTWGYASSVGEPYDSLVTALDMRKQKYAIDADIIANNLLSCYYKSLGEVSISYDRSSKFRIINETDYNTTKLAKLTLEHWQYLEGEVFNEKNLLIKDLSSNVYYDFNVKNVAGKFIIELMLNMEPNQIIDVIVLKNNPKNKFYLNDVADGVNDINNYQLDTKYFVVSVKESKIKIFDKCTNKYLDFNEKDLGIFTPVYEVTQADKYSTTETRKFMGRNRKSASTSRFYGEITNFNFKTNNIYDTLFVEYQLNGTKFFNVELIFSKVHKNIEVNVTLAKELSWDPENLYLTLPSYLSEKQTIYLNKSGCLFNPSSEYLPNLNFEFYLLQEGLIVKDGNSNIAISSKDCPLITLKDLDDLGISNDPSKIKNGKSVKSWIMNNFWETNFKADLSGFYEFKYYINFDIITNIDMLKSLNGEHTVIYID